MKLKLKPFSTDSTDAVGQRRQASVGKENLNETMEEGKGTGQSMTAI